MSQATLLTRFEFHLLDSLGRPQEELWWPKQFLKNYSRTSNSHPKALALPKFMAQNHKTWIRQTILWGGWRTEDTTCTLYSSDHAPIGSMSRHRWLYSTPVLQCSVTRARQRFLTNRRLSRWDNSLFGEIVTATAPCPWDHLAGQFDDGYDIKMACVVCLSVCLDSAIL